MKANIMQPEGVEVAHATLSGDETAVLVMEEGVGDGGSFPSITVKWDGRKWEVRSPSGDDVNFIEAD